MCDFWSAGTPGPTHPHPGQAALPFSRVPPPGGLAVSVPRTTGSSGAEAVGQFLHDVRGEERVLLDEVMSYQPVTMWERVCIRERRELFFWRILRRRLAKFADYHFAVYSGGKLKTVSASRYFQDLRFRMRGVVRPV